MTSCRGSVMITTLVTLYLIVYSIDALKIDDCTLGTQADAKLEAVTITDCSTERDDYCRFVQGKNVSIEVDFETITPFKTALVEIYGKISLIPIPFNIKPNNACGNYGFDCPVNSNEKKKLKITMPILRVYPKIPIKVQLKMLDEKKNPIICVEFPVKITSS